MTHKAQTLTINRYWDGFLVFVAIAAICVVGFRLYVTEWTDHLDILVYISFFAGIAGLALGYSRFSAPIAALFSTLYGTFILGWLLGTTVSIEMSWHNRIINYLGWRLRMALHHFRHNEPFNDPLLFLMLMGVVLWILGSLASYLLIRKGRVWPLLIPFGVALLIVGQYDQNQSLNAGYLLAFLFFFLILVGRMTFLHDRQSWGREGIITNAGVRADLSKSLLMLSVALLAFAWLIPVTSSQINTTLKLWNAITQRWDRFSERVESIFTFDSGTRQATSEIFYQDDMTLGEGSQPGNDPVFTVEALSRVPAGYRHYWRTRSYDYYEAGEWSFNVDEREEFLFPDSFDIAYPEWVRSQIASYRFTTQVRRTDVVYAPGRPIWVDRPVQASILTLRDAEEDLIGLVADPEMVDGDTYELRTIINLPTIAELRETSMDYPDWTAAYLQLPEDFPVKIVALSLKLLRGIDNPYDKVASVTQYLRDNITYASTITPAPEGEDPIAWFLFESQEGFCNYYATAQVLMLRSVGIPARLSVGYAQGTYDADTNTYAVLESNSHAWPEVYFEDYGWVIFEPTVSEESYVLPATRPQNENALDPGMSNLPLIDTEAELTPEPRGLNGDIDSDIIPGQDIRGVEDTNLDRILVLIAVGSVFAVIYLIRRKVIRINLQMLPVYFEKLLKKLGFKVPRWLRRWSRLSQLPPVEKAYRQISRSLRLMGHTLSSAETPSERAQALVGLLPQASTPAQTIAEEFNLDKYSQGSQADEKRARFAAEHIRRLARRTWMQRKLHFWQKTSS